MAGPNAVQRLTKEDLPRLDHRHPVRHALHFPEQVGGEEDGAAFVSDGADDRPQDVTPHNRVEA